MMKRCMVVCRVADVSCYQWYTHNSEIVPRLHLQLEDV